MHRLEGPLVPFDVVEIASDALAVFEEDAKAAAAAGKEDRGRDTTAIDLSEALLESLRLLLGGLPGGNEAAGRPEPEARRIIGGLLERLERPLVPFDILEIANEALAALALNGKATLERHRLHSEELQAMISMLTETVAALSVQSTASVTRLQQIERKIEQASMVEDLRSLKANLAECLDAVREASVHQQKQTAETIQLFERQIQTAKSRCRWREPPRQTRPTASSRSRNRRPLSTWWSSCWIERIPSRPGSARMPGNRFSAL